MEDRAERQSDSEPWMLPGAVAAVSMLRSFSQCPMSVKSRPFLRQSHHGDPIEKRGLTTRTAFVAAPARAATSCYTDAARIHVKEGGARNGYPWGEGDPDGPQRTRPGHTDGHRRDRRGG